MKDIATSFNEHFLNIGPSLSEKIDMSENDMTYNDYLENSAHSRFPFSSVSEKETLNSISKLKKFWNRWHFKCRLLLKSIANEIIEPLTLIINQSLETGIFPDAFKTSKVTPVYKKGDKTNLNNYREEIVELRRTSEVFKIFKHFKSYA